MTSAAPAFLDLVCRLSWIHINHEAPERIPIRIQPVEVVQVHAKFSRAVDIPDPEPSEDRECPCVSFHLGIDERHELAA